MRSTILFLLSLPLLFSCSEQEELATDGSNGAENIPAGISRVSFISDSQSQCVYIFRKEDGSFRYDSMMDSGWSEDGTRVANLLIGDYKFLFTDMQEGQLDVLPASLDESVTLDRLRFVARTDTAHEGGILPVGELFLPKPEVADSVYAIRGNDKIKCTLYRRVGQLEFILRRGYKKDGMYVEQPYTDGGNILKKVQALQIEIAGVARECNYEKFSGEGTVFQTYLADERASIDGQGFATFTGPFVFPPADEKEVNLKITAIAPSNEAYPPLSLTGKLNANQKLEVNLWFTSSSGFQIGVTMVRKPLSGQTEGDMGVWN